MSRPPHLKIGDQVAIVATAKKLEPGQIDGAIQLIDSWGLRVVCGPNLYSADRQFAGTDEQRTHDLQWALDDQEIKAVIFARGGYGTSRIIDKINWNKFKSSPKWLCGFSDLTVLHAHVHQLLNIETLHSTMPIFFADGSVNEGSESLRNALFGNINALTWEPHKLNRQGASSGQIIGGNLSVLGTILNTPSEPDFNGKILFIEDLTEYYYHLDRMMVQLKRAGILESISALVVGQFTEMMDNPVPFGKSAEEIIFESVSDYEFPVAFNAPIGHVLRNMTVYFGRESEVIVNGQLASIEY